MQSQITDNHETISSSLNKAVPWKRWGFYVVIPNKPNCVQNFWNLYRIYNRTAVICFFISSKEWIYHFSFISRKEAKKACNTLKSINLNIYYNKNEWNDNICIEFITFRMTISATLCQMSLIYKDLSKFELCKSFFESNKTDNLFIQFDEDRLIVNVLHKERSHELEDLLLKIDFPKPDIHEIHTIETNKKLTEFLGVSEDLAGLEFTYNDNGKLVYDYILPSGNYDAIVKLGRSLGDEMEIISNVLVFTNLLKISPDDYHFRKFQESFPSVNWDIDEMNTYIKFSASDLKAFKIIKNAVPHVIKFMKFGPRSYSSCSLIGMDRVFTNRLSLLNKFTY
jgi:hypothetical protein